MLLSARCTKPTPVVTALGVLFLRLSVEWGVGSSKVLCYRFLGGCAVRQLQARFGRSGGRQVGPPLCAVVCFCWNSYHLHPFFVCIFAFACVIYVPWYQHSTCFSFRFVAQALEYTRCGFFPLHGSVFFVCPSFNLSFMFARPHPVFLVRWQAS